MIIRTAPTGLLAALLLGSTSGAFAFQPLITDDTGTQGADGNQIEFSCNRDVAKASGDTTRTHTLPLVFTRGLTDTLDVFIQANHAAIRSTVPGSDASGGGNASFGAKWRFYENDESKTSLGFKPEVRLPVSTGKEAAGLGTGRTSFGTTFILTQETSFGAVHVNLAHGRDDYREAAPIPDAVRTRLSVAPVWDVTEEWKVGLDLGTETARANGPIRADFFEVGGIYSPSSDLDFALGLVRRLDTDHPSVATTSVTIGVTWRFK